MVSKILRCVSLSLAEAVKAAVMAAVFLLAALVISVFLFTLPAGQ